MKITPKQLRRIIREELDYETALGQHPALDIPRFGSAFEGPDEDAFVAIGYEISNALNHAAGTIIDMGFTEQEAYEIVDYFVSEFKVNS